MPNINATNIPFSLNIFYPKNYQSLKIYKNKIHYNHKPQTTTQSRTFISQTQTFINSSQSKFPFRVHIHRPRKLSPNRPWEYLFNRHFIFLAPSHGNPRVVVINLGGIQSYGFCINFLRHFVLQGFHLLFNPLNSHFC